MKISPFLVPGSEEVYYISNFVSNAEEEYLIRKVCESPKQKWKHPANRRLQVLGGEITPKNQLLSQAMPAYIDSYPDIVTRLRETGAFRSSPHGGPNHVILNEYLPGQGIMPHEDGPAYFPVVATISLGSHTVFHYYKYRSDVNSDIPVEGGGRAVNSSPALSILLEPRSVVITMSSFYSSCLHGIQEIAEDVIAVPPRLDDNGHAQSDHIPGHQDEEDIPLLAGVGSRVANWKMITGENRRQILDMGGVMKRCTRYSLTCRDVERVSRASIGKR